MSDPIPAKIAAIPCTLTRCFCSIGTCGRTSCPSDPDRLCKYDRDHRWDSADVDIDIHITRPDGTGITATFKYSNVPQSVIDSVRSFDQGKLYAWLLEETDAVLVNGG
jgi:hypothetical protein